MPKSASSFVKLPTQQPSMKGIQKMERTTNFHCCHHLNNRGVALSSEVIERKKEQMDVWFMGTHTVSVTRGGGLATNRN